MAGILVFLAIIAGIIGFFLLSQATMGVGVIALGCLFGIMARLAQAGSHAKQLREALKYPLPQTIEPPAPKE